MAWLFPAALAGLVAVLGPVIVHLLRRQRSRRLIVPTVRFVPAVDQSVLRIRRPADLPLLLLRMAIVTCAALALARPLLLTSARTSGWAERTARAVIVDASDPAVAAAGNEAAQAELQTAAISRRVDAAELGIGLQRAAAWLATSPPARREIVVLSDFQRGALDEPLIRQVPDMIGMRFIPVTATAAGSREVLADAVLSVSGQLDRRVRMDETTTAATYSRRPVPGDGLRLLFAPKDADDAAAALRVGARAGAVAPVVTEPIVVRFPGGEPLPVATAPAADGWAARAAVRLLTHADKADLPLDASVGGNALLVDVHAAPGSVLGAESLKAALDARIHPRKLAEQEIARIPAERLNAWTRPAAPADTGAWQQSDESDARWLWIAALVLLALESFVRRSVTVVDSQVDAHAA